MANLTKSPQYSNEFTVTVSVSKNVKSVDEFRMNLQDPKSDQVCHVTLCYNTFKLYGF